MRRGIPAIMRCGYGTFGFRFTVKRAHRVRQIHAAIHLLHARACQWRLAVARLSCPYIHLPHVCVLRRTPVRTRAIHAVARIRLRRPSQYQQQFLAFVAGGHNMHFAYGPVEIGDRLAPVQHGRQFDQRALRFGEQQVTQFEYVRCAILDRVGARAMLVAAGRIDVDEIHRIHVVEVFHAVVAHDTRLVESQCGHVVLGQIAQVSLPFHISGLAESARQIREVHTEPARQIHHRPFRHQCVRFWRIGQLWLTFRGLVVRFCRIGHSGAHGCGRRKQGLRDFGLVLGCELR